MCCSDEAGRVETFITCTACFLVCRGKQDASFVLLNKGYRPSSNSRNMGETGRPVAQVDPVRVVAVSSKDPKLGIIPVGWMHVPMHFVQYPLNQAQLYASFHYTAPTCGCTTQLGTGEWPDTDSECGS